MHSFLDLVVFALDEERNFLHVEFKHIALFFALLPESPQEVGLQFDQSDNVLNAVRHSFFFLALD